MRKKKNWHEIRISISRVNRAMCKTRAEKMSNLLKKTTFFAVMTAFCLFATLSGAQANSRIKDIADIEGVRDNPLIGYGLVVGLNGTGDNISSMAFT